MNWAEDFYKKEKDFFFFSQSFHFTRNLVLDGDVGGEHPGPSQGITQSIRVIKSG